MKKVCCFSLHCLVHFQSVIPGLRVSFQSLDVTAVGVPAVTSKFQAAGPRMGRPTLPLLRICFRRIPCLSAKVRIHTQRSFNHSGGWEKGARWLCAPLPAMMWWWCQQVAARFTTSSKHENSRPFFSSFILLRMFLKSWNLFSKHQMFPKGKKRQTKGKYKEPPYNHRSETITRFFFCVCVFSPRIGWLHNPKGYITLRSESWSIANLGP